MEHRIADLERDRDEHDHRLTNLEREEQRTRRRLHELESDRAALRHLTKTATDVYEAAKTLQDNALEIIETAASRAVEKAFRKRREMRWQTALRVSAILGGLGGLGLLIVDLFHPHL